MTCNLGRAMVRKEKEPGSKAVDYIAIEVRK